MRTTTHAFAAILSAASVMLACSQAQADTSVRETSDRKEGLGGAFYAGGGIGVPNLSAVGFGVSLTERMRVLMEAGTFGAMGVFLASGGLHLQHALVCDGRGVCIYGALSTYVLYGYFAQIDASPGEPCCSEEHDVGWGTGPGLGLEINPWAGLQIMLEGGVLVGDWSEYPGLNLNTITAPYGGLRVGYSFGAME